MKQLMVLTGSGMSADSGLKTFRDMGGLWNQYDVTEVVSPEAWQRDPGLVLHFYNERRRQLMDAVPNEGHKVLVELEDYYDVSIITQNIDDLHERAGSSRVMHLHGELRKARSTGDPGLIYDMEGSELNMGDQCEKGYQLRPHVVWFGEEVPRISEAASLVKEADIFVIIGTSLSVYPAAGLVNFVDSHCPIFVVDPNPVHFSESNPVHLIQEKACKGAIKLKKKLLANF